MRRRIENFFKTPKGLVTIILAIFTAMAAPGQGVRAVAAGLGSAVIAAGLVDALILRARKKAWEFPSGAVLTAMIVAMVLRAQEPWYVTTITSVIAVLSKYAVPHAIGERVQSGGAGDHRQLSTSSTPARAGGAR